MTTTEASKLVAICMATWPNHPVANVDALVTAWALALRDVPYDAAQDALTTYLREGAFFPAPSELFERVVDATGAIPSADEAWSLVQHRIRTTYPGHPAAEWDAPYPVRRATQAMGGIHNLRMSENPSVDRAHFIKFYNENRKQAVRYADVAALIEHGAKALEPRFGALFDGVPEAPRRLAVIGEGE